MPDEIKTKVVVAMSGGVDSSTTAFLLREQEYDVTGMFMRLGSGEGSEGERAARAVCRKLGIKFYPVDLAGKFREEVIDYFLDSYTRGLTPNPCVRCNRMIKFGELLRVMRELGAEYLATGHYIKMSNVKCQMSNVYKLFRGADINKDQSYFLYTLGQEQLRHILFPLGELTKTEVRKIADGAGLPYLKKESQDVCFLHQDGKIIEHNEFLKKYLKLTPGPIMTMDGKKVGEHAGLPLYTAGQRKGIEIGGTGPYYAARMDYKANTLYVVRDFDDPALCRDHAEIGEVNWVSGREPEVPLSCEAVIRYRHKAVKCKVIKFPPEADPLSAEKIKSYRVIFDEPQRAVTPGQSIVFYLGDEVIGGGIITVNI